MTAGLPRDPAQWLALLAALAVLAAARPLVRPSARRFLFPSLAGLSAAGLSAAYIPVYLRGGPRIIDATTYWLEARALSEGFFSFPLREPETSVLGRFLVRSAWPDGAHAAGIFPPGYPAVLALGFLTRAPLAVGPILAAAVTVVTFDLAGHLARGLGVPGSPSIPRLAAVLSVVCAALRYHTADTMSHGLAALCFGGALALAFRACDALAAGLVRRALLLAAGSGLAAGWLFATRPVSSLALTPVLALALFRGDVLALPARVVARLLPALAAGAIPGVTLFFVHQYAATGALGASSQQLYYAVSDGPPGCFRYGFGHGIGCLWEHGDFVRSRLPDGYGAFAAAGTTLRRLKMHLVDPANAEPLALLVPAGAWIARRSARGRALGIAIAAQILAYLPFYFDGNYPAGGARFYADVLPIEHALAAVAIAAFASRRRAPERWAAGVIAMALAGFTFRAGFDHASLRDRDGGRPLFEPAELARAGITRGLVFFETDHGFDLAFHPAAITVEAARFHGDALDRFAWEAHGRPPAFRYHFEPSVCNGPGAVELTPLTFPEMEGALFIAAASLWPPIAQQNGWALPEYTSGTCASGSRWLELHAEDDDTPASVTVALPATATAGRDVRVRVATGGGARGDVVLAIDGISAEIWSLPASSSPEASCYDLPRTSVPRGAKRVEVTLRQHRTGRVSGRGSLLALDRVELLQRETD